MFLDQGESRAGSDLGDGLKVIASEKDAEIDELRSESGSVFRKAKSDKGNQCLT